MLEDDRLRLPIDELFLVQRTSFQAWDSRAACATSSGTETIPGSAASLLISRIGHCPVPRDRCSKRASMCSSASMRGFRFSKRLCLSKPGKPVRCRYLKTSVSTDWSVPESRFGLETKKVQRSRRPMRARRCPGLSERRDGIHSEKIPSPRAQKLIDKWKLFAGYAAPGTGNRDTYPHRIISTPFIGEPGSISSETYLCIGPLDSKREAESVLSYLSCRLTRLLVLLRKPSQQSRKRCMRSCRRRTGQNNGRTRTSTRNMTSPRQRSGFHREDCPPDG